MPAEYALRFPNPDLTSRLVLYPLAGGGVALDWHLDPALIEHAQTAFAAHRPQSKLYLRRADADGGCLAEADLADLRSNCSGHARFQTPLVGALQAELGLEGQHDGGWLLLARSNRLDAIPEPVARSTRTELGEAQAAAPASVVGSGESQLDASQPAALMRPEPTALLAPLAEREQALLPALEPASVPAPVTDSAPAPVSVPVPELVPPPVTDSAPNPPADPVTASVRSTPAESEPKPAMQPELGMELGSSSMPVPGSEPVREAEPTPWQPPISEPRSQSLMGLGPAPSRQPGAVASISAAVEIAARKGSVSPTRFPDPSLAALAARPELRGSAFPLVRAGRSAVGAVAEQELLHHQPPNRQDDGRLEWPVAARIGFGSGPLSPYPSGEDAVIEGELHLFGRAAPGSLLDLGGHPFRVGPGGRFSFRVAIDDPALLSALLARLPRLPVAERES